MATLGLPPELQLFLTEWYRQIKLLSMIVWLRYQVALDYQRHLQLPPAEQYRRHLRAGGWAAY